LSTDAQERIALARRLHDDFRLFAKHCLKIRDKAGQVLPFELNAAQLYIHERIEDQLARTGKVRVLILKGRQQGASTYTEGRFYWRTATRKGRRTLIIAHEQVASDNLFTMAKRYHDNMPLDLKPSTVASNAKELVFGVMDSGYKVMTAGSKAVGRSQTANYLHASEFAFWDNAGEHMAGIAQAVPDLPGSEIIIESTAKGMGNEFHSKVQLARAGRGDYELIFIPWFWTAEYRREVPADWRRTEKEDELSQLYELDDEQLAWRRHKIDTDFAGDDVKFMEEYPCCVDEAFQAEKRETFMRLSEVMAARRYMLPEPARGPLVIGVDPAGAASENSEHESDRTAIALRRGREVLKLVTKRGDDTMQITGLVVTLIKLHKPARVFVDKIGIGAGVVDRLKELGYGEIVRGVNVALPAIDDESYHNHRAEVWGRMREWLAGRDVSIPDHDPLQMDLLQCGYKYDSRGRYQLESKKDIKARNAPSPDLADAIALTFSEFVSEDPPEEGRRGNLGADRVGGY
jgi:hypothetical protein